MKTIKIDNLPEQVQHNGETYYKNAAMTSGWERNNTPIETIKATLKKEGRKVVIVEVFNKHVQNATDLHGKAYPSTKWLFTTNATGKK